MRRGLLVLVIMALGLSSADAHRRRHHHHHHPDVSVSSPGGSAQTDAASDSRLPTRPSQWLPDPVPSAVIDTGGKADAGPPATQALDGTQGPLHVIISLHDQRLTMYRNGLPVAHSKVSTGTTDHRTPTGVFSVIERQRWHESNLYSLAPMPFMQRITWSGIALHAGIVPGHPASHGCIRLPSGFAKQLWGTTKIGTRVIVAAMNTAPVEIVHPQLTALVAKSEPELVRDVGDTLAAAPDPAAPGTADAGVTSATADRSAIPAEATRAKDAGTGELVSVFVSRKEGKLFIRSRFKPVFDVPITIQQPDNELGTHLFTAMGEGSDGAMRWVAVTMPNASSDQLGNNSRKGSPRPEPAQPALTDPAPTAAEALDRIEIPPEAVSRISELLAPGASLIISDQGIGSETGRGTDFVVVLPGHKTRVAATGEKTRASGRKSARRHATRYRYARGFFGWPFPW